MTNQIIQNGEVLKEKTSCHRQKADMNYILNQKINLSPDEKGARNFDELILQYGDYEFFRW